MRKDLVQHVLLSFFLTLCFGFMYSIILMYIKERWHDGFLKLGTMDWSDMDANFIGCFLGHIVRNTLINAL